MTDAMLYWVKTADIDGYRCDEKDPIVWKSSAEGDLYHKLLALKSSNTALWNAHWGARMIPVVNSAPDQVLSFVRQNEKAKAFAVINLSDQAQSVSLKALCVMVITRITSPRRLPTLMAPLILISSRGVTASS